ncbi:hypothetical protein ACNOYE_04065 [Nannocystaceae bacterium ST9]
MTGMLEPRPTVCKEALERIPEFGVVGAKRAALEGLPETEREDFSRGIELRLGWSFTAEVHLIGIDLHPNLKEFGHGRVDCGPRGLNDRS